MYKILNKNSDNDQNFEEIAFYYLHMSGYITRVIGKNYYYKLPAKEVQIDYVESLLPLLKRSLLTDN